MDWLYPGSIDLFSVQFQGNCRVTSIHNLNLLQAAFRKAGLNQVSIVSIMFNLTTSKILTLWTCILACIKRHIDMSNFMLNLCVSTKYCG